MAKGDRSAHVGSDATRGLRILFIVPYPLGIAPSQRFRFEQYFAELDRRAIRYTVRPFLDTEAMGILYKSGNLGLKVWKVLRGMALRLTDLFRVRDYDVVFIHREAVPLGPPVIEWVLCKLTGKRVVFDFDDAIWLRNTSEGNPIISYLKRYRNADDLCRWATVVSCGNRYLCDHARLFNPHVVHNPTTIDTVGHHNRVRVFAETMGKVVIGWTGTHSTIRYLEQLVPVLQRLRTRFDFELLVIADRAPEFSVEGMRFVPWKKDTEIDDLLQMHVGIMPLEDDAWSRGKCGFKALQYMALGIPAIVSPVGVNTEIVQHGTNGFVCADAAAWEQTLAEVLTRPKHLATLSAAARHTIEERYSVVANTGNFIRLLDERG
jgi:glycosyltransferase involved in cell wall biosynthesis